jgi:hypothetical protein
MVSALLLLPTPSIAKTEVVYASYKYVMGDNDTKNDAKRLCFLEAKRRCLEKVGSYVESLTEVQQYKLTRDEIRSYTSAIVKVEVVSEKIAFEGQSVVINTRVKAEVDADHTKKELQRIAKDKGLQARIKKQQTQIESLESKIRTLQANLDSSSYERSFELREQRDQTFDDLYVENERMRKIILAKRARDARRPNIVAKRKKNRRLVLKYVEIGMTPDEVISVIKEITPSPTPTLGSTFDVKTGRKKESFYEWDKIYFDFDFDEFLKMEVLKNILYFCKDTKKALQFEAGKVDFRFPILKGKDFNILNFDFDQFEKETLYYSFSNPRFSIYERTIGVCPNEVRAHIFNWAEE